MTDNEKLAYRHAAELANRLLTDVPSVQAMVLENASGTEALLVISNDPTVNAVIRSVLALVDVVEIGPPI